MIYITRLFKNAPSRLQLFKNELPGVNLQPEILAASFSANFNTKKCNRLTFLSTESQNKMLSILAEIVRSKILWDIKKSNLFSVIIDTTTDISNKEQFTFLMRYVNEQGNIEERLVALVTAPDLTGRGLFEVFCNITEKYGIDWKKR